MKTRFSVESVLNVDLGEVVYLPLDESGFCLGDMSSSYLRALKGGTLIATAVRNGYRKFFFGWTEHDEDLPSDASAFSKDFLVTPGSYSNVRLAANIDRYTRFLQHGSSAFVVRLPEAMRLTNVKAPPVGDSLICTGCKEPVLQAAPNMADGSFKCYSCRSNPYR
jgi:hypothetical protein